MRKSLWGTVLLYASLGLSLMQLGTFEKDKSLTPTAYEPGSWLQGIASPSTLVLPYQHTMRSTNHYYIYIYRYHKNWSHINHFSSHPTVTAFFQKWNEVKSKKHNIQLFRMFPIFTSHDLNLSLSLSLSFCGSKRLFFLFLCSSSWFFGGGSHWPRCI